MDFLVLISALFEEFKRPFWCPFDLQQIQNPLVCVCVYIYIFMCHFLRFNDCPNASKYRHVG